MQDEVLKAISTYDKFLEENGLDRKTIYAAVLELLSILNSILEFKPGEIVEGQLVIFNEVNVEMKQASNRVFYLGHVYGRMQRLEMVAKRFYEHTKATALLKAGQLQNRDIYPDASLRKSYADLESEEDLQMYENIKSFVNMIHIERQDLWDYRKRLEVISKNLQAEAYSNR